MSGHATRTTLAGAALAALCWSSPALVRAQDDAPEVVKTLLAEGDRQRQAGRAEEAIASYEEARRLDPTVVETYVALGALYHGRGDYDRALAVFEGGLEHDPRQPELLYYAAGVSQQLGRPESALDYVERALGAERRNAELLSLKSRILRELDRLDEALEAQRSAVQLDASSNMLYRLGNLYFELDRKDEAIDAFRRATRKDKSHLRAWYNLGAALFEVGQLDEALKAYLVALDPVEEALAANRPVEPSTARAYLNLGTIYAQNEDFQAALEAYGMASRLDPEGARGFYNQGLIHYRLGRREEAAEAYERALALDGDLPLADLHLGEIRHDRGEPREAVPHLERAAAKLAGDDRRQALLALAEARLALAETDAAKAAYDAVLAEDPVNLEALVALGAILRDEGDAERSRELLERARSLDPGHPGAALELAGLARTEGDLARERDLYEDLLRRSGGAPEMWPVRVNLARALVEQGDDEAALDAFAPVVERLEELTARGLEARAGDSLATIYGLLLASRGRLDDAEESLRPLVRNGSGFIPARDAVAVLEAIGGDPRRAADALAATLDEHLGTDSENGARANLGLTLWLAGRPGEAREHLERAARADPGNAAVRLALGEIAFGAGELESAVEWLEEAAAGCGRQPAPRATVGRRMSVVLGRGSSKTLCDRASKSLATALVAAAFADLEGGRAPAAARSRVNRALELPLTGEEHAVAHLVRGTVELLAGADQKARSDLSQALEGLPEPLRAVARNNLAVARYRLGEVEAARSELEAAVRTGKTRQETSEATLNLAILFDDETGDGARALELYEAYVAGGGRRRAEVEGWIERLRKVYE